MSKIYADDLTSDVIDDMKDPENIFKSFNLQSYFESDNCNIDDFDYYPIASVLKKIQEKQLANTTEQLQLSTIFYSDSLVPC